MAIPGTRTDDRRSSLGSHAFVPNSKIHFVCDWMPPPADNDATQRAPEAMPIHVEEAFATESSFLNSAQAAIRDFRFERTNIGSKHYTLKVDGHTAGIGMRFREWKPFRGRAWRMAPYEGPVVALTDFLVRAFNLRTIYDVGAGMGFHSFMAATIEGHDTVVHAFEMQPDVFARITTMAAGYPEVSHRLVPHLAGMSEHHTGQRTVWHVRRNLYETKPDARQVREPWHRQLKFWWLGRRNSGTLREAEILITTIDRFASDTGGAPELMKIDVDGYEGKVLSGAGQTLKARPFILLELHKDKLLQRCGSTRMEVVSKLFDAGYRAALLTNHNDHTLCQLRKVERTDPSFRAQATMMFLFY